MSLSYVKPERLNLKSHADLNEIWVRDRIRDDPTILGLGDLEVKDAERMQPKAGRIDLLLRDPETDTRYEVELMLGGTDESHIIRVIEYWDIERKRYPQYEHVAVLIAEDITSRFMNVIALFNGSIPIVALQLSALKFGDNVMLSFAKVLDLLVRGEDDEDELGGGQTDRAYWEKKGSKESLQMADACFEIIKRFDDTAGLTLKYNKYYIGLSDQYRARNYVVFRAKKGWLRVEVRTADQEPWGELLEEKGVEVLPGQKKRARLVFNLKKGELKALEGELQDLFKAAYDESRI